MVSILFKEVVFLNLKNELILYLTVMGVKFGYVADDNVINLRIFLDGDNNELL